LSHAISLHSNHWATFNIPGSLVHIHTSLHSSTSFNLLERLLYHSRYAKQLPRKTCWCIDVLLSTTKSPKKTTLGQASHRPYITSL
jgi:hypothetical protein